jgi:hypothetical protein
VDYEQLVVNNVVEHKLSVIDKPTFFRLLLKKSRSNNQLFYPGIYPDASAPTSLKIHQFKFAPTLESTYIISSGYFAWLDPSELPFFERFMTSNDSGTPLLSFSGPEIIYPDIHGCLPIWITAGLSRGSHSFHYAHFAVDHMTAASYISNDLEIDNALFLQDLVQPWQQSLLKFYPQRYDFLAFPDTFSLRSKHFPNIVTFSIKACIFDYCPFLSSASSRSSLVKYFFANKLRNFTTPTTTHPSIVGPSTEAWFLTRSKVANTRITNESEIIKVLSDIFPKMVVIEPESSQPERLINSINKTNPIIFSACSGALDPLMLLCSRLPQIVMFSPFSWMEIFSQKNPLGIYQDIANLSSTPNNFVPLGTLQSPESASWNTRIKVNPIALHKVLNLMVGRTFSRPEIEKLYYATRIDGQYAVQCV